MLTQFEPPKHVVWKKVAAQREAKIITALPPLHGKQTKHLQEAISTCQVHGLKAKAAV